ERILRMLRCEAVLITRGEQGMCLLERGRRPLSIGTAAREVFDVTGAGDTVVATLALALGSGARLKEAAVLANCAAGVGGGEGGPRVRLPRRGPGRPPGRSMRVAVVGAGPAGSLLALRLAEGGIRALLFDASHPREKPCGGGLTGKALALLPKGPDQDPLPA